MAPDNHLIVCRHFVITQQFQPLIAGQCVYRLKVANTAQRITLSKRFIKVLVTRCREASIIAKWAIDTRYAAIGQYGPKTLKHALDAKPRHDMQRIGREYSVILPTDHLRRPRISRDIEFQRRPHVWRALGLNAFAQTRQGFRPVTRMPLHVPEVAPEMDRMLTGTAADLQYATAARQRVLQGVQNRMLVTFAGFRMVEHCAKDAPERWRKILRPAGKPKRMRKPCPLAGQPGTRSLLAAAPLVFECILRIALHLGVAIAEHQR